MIGVLPTPEEARTFLADKSADKRSKLIDRLLERPEFADHWALFLGDLLQNRKERDHDVRGSKGVRGLHQWLREQVARNRPWDAMVRDLLTVTGDTDAQPAVGYYVDTIGEERESHRSSVVPSAAQTFLGTRIGCAQCHNHPLEKYTQDDFYHFAGFFSRVRLERKDPKTNKVKRDQVFPRFHQLDVCPRAFSGRPRKRSGPAGARSALSRLRQIEFDRGGIADHPFRTAPEPQALFRRPGPISGRQLVKQDMREIRSGSSPRIGLAVADVRQPLEAARRRRVEKLRELGSGYLWHSRYPASTPHPHRQPAQEDSPSERRRVI